MPTFAPSVTLSVILPCFNEAQNIARTVHDVDAWFRKAEIEGRIIVVDDGSTDKTQYILRTLCEELPHMECIRHTQNQGYGSAVCSGCNAAETDIIGFMDSDGQFNPADFRQLLPHVQKFGIVTGRRRKRADPLMRKLNAKLFGFLVWAVLGVWVRDINCGMKLFRRSTWEKVRPVQSTGALVNAEMFYRASTLGIPWHQVDVPHYPRTFGRQTGARPGVIARMFKELWQLRQTGCTAPAVGQTVVHS